MKILCINGGGIFGIIPIYFLYKAGIDIGSMFDAYGGTSVGSQIVLALASGKSIDEIFTYFKAASPNIFSKSIWSHFNAFSPEYDDAGLNKELMTFLPGKFTDIKKPVFVPAYDFVNHVPKVFDNVMNSFDLDWNTWEIARASSAAPTYFAPYKGYIDGGVVINNPSMAVAWGLKHKLNIPFEDMEILVIGTGTAEEPKYTSDEICHWTQVKWVRPLIDILINGNIEVFDFGCKAMPFRKYAMFNPIELPKDWGMDDPTIIPDILAKCDPFIDDFNKVLAGF
jgi:patatin-like phospholipase/acyl hydrolase